MLHLTQPLAFIDIETTGLDIVNDRIVEIAIVKVLVDGSKKTKRKLINPGIAIPHEVSDIHGITDEMVKNAPVFKDIATELSQFIDRCDLAGFNSNRFDIPLLAEEFLRAGVDFNIKGRKMVDVQHVYHKMEERTLSAAYKFYCKKNLDDAHSAAADANATHEILVAQTEKYKDLGNSVKSILNFIGDEEIVDFARRIKKVNGVEVFNFGKYKGKSLEEVFIKEPQYYDWIMRSNFALHTQNKMTEVYNRCILNNKNKVRV